MLTLTSVGTAANGSAAANPGRVQDDMLLALRHHGLPCPIRGIHDPRLEYPELLLIGGWERSEVDGGIGYRMVADENAATHDRWEQYYEVRNDANVLVTRAGHKQQTITETAEGRITSTTARVDDE